MARIPLRAYDREIGLLIENGKFDEAILHCRQILQTFPQHVETLRLLGKAHLESKRYDEALEILERVQRIVPGDFVASVGLSIIADERGQQDASIRHMQRAFESQPSNPVVQGELQRLYARRDGVRPPKIRMTRGALAHMYVQGELYSQAISEIRAVLGQEKGRSDLRVLLAHAYLRSGQRTEAVSTCQDLLREFPDCLDAHRILAELLPSGAGEGGREPHRRRVIEFDPYAASCKGSLFAADQVAETAVQLERLADTGKPRQATPAPPAAPDLNAPGRRAAAVNSTPSTALGEPKPLEELTGPPAAMPDAMTTAGWGTPRAGFDERQLNSSELVEPPPELTPAELPDWLKEQLPADEQTAGGRRIYEFGATPAELGAERDASIAPAEAQGADRPGDAERNAVPSWPVNPDERTSTPGSRPSDAPAWQSFESLPSETETGGSRTGVQPADDEDDSLAWLQALAARQGGETEPADDLQPEASDRQTLWGDLSSGQDVLERPPAQAASIPPAEDDTAAWLRSLEDRTAEMGETADERVMGTGALFSATDGPDWLRSPTPEDTIPVHLDQPETQPRPDWLGEFRAVSETVPHAGMEQLEGAGLGEGALEGALPPEKGTGDGASATSEVSWVSDAEPAKPPGPMPDDDLPAWITADEEAPKAAPTTAADWRPLESATERSAAAATTAPMAEPSTVGRIAEAIVADEKTLVGAQEGLQRGDLPAALEAYSRMIRKGRFVEEAIHDLRDAVYRYPVDVSVWQTLGDAYMRANRLQEALDAYNKAEELLR